MNMKKSANRFVRKLRKNEYTLYEAKLFSKFPGSMKQFLKFLKERKILISRRRIPDEFVRYGWFTYLDYESKYQYYQPKKSRERVREFAVTERGIDMIKWLVNNHIDELKLKKEKHVNKKRQKRHARRQSSSNKSAN
jgi:hypothetical protein